MSALNRLYASYGKRVAFYVVYVREAHATDGARPRFDVDVTEPTTLEERLGVAARCQADLGVELPMLIDGIDDATERAYSGFPDRLFLIDTEGKVAYRGAPGPRGFKPAELEAAIERLLAAPPPSAEELEAIEARLKARRKAQLEGKR